MFNGKNYNERSSGTNSVLEYCYKNKISKPIWLKACMDNWGRYETCYYNTHNNWFSSDVSLLDEFAEMAIWIMDELKGGWGIMVDGTFASHYMFELEDEAFKFKLRWF